MKMLKIAALAAAMTVACKKEKNNPAPAPALPTIASFSPTSARGGESVTITGENFSTIASENTVTFNDIAAVVTTAGATQLTVTVPDSDCSGAVKVTVGGKTATAADQFTWLPAALQRNGIEVVAVPSGTFLMGSSDGSNIGDGNGSGLNTTASEPSRLYERQRWVQLTADFYLSRYEITNAQYAKFLNDNSIGSDGIGSLTSDGTQEYIDDCSQSGFTNQCGVQWNSGQGKWEPAPGKDNFPVVYVTWYGAKAFAEKAGGALPTEAQWEYACRGGQTTSLPFGVGTGRKLMPDMANFAAIWPYDLDHNPSGQYTDTGLSSQDKNNTTAVGSYQTYNAYGLYDMHGNVAEWCGDSMDFNNIDYPATGTSQAAPAVDPFVNDVTHSYRALRGGSWYSGAQESRSAFRGISSPDTSNDHIGFRVVWAQ
ncbi:MAG: SUMF1/EgtB/PvdO family nonheme iron enzyme [Rikenellaceae bacterium]|jgi:formylglycine-generating enzyme required for sulfatase activity|nr:SUMF1/EgtB/PvdO family nonheme iron enzyme [Rikenellaceae bacterium]